MCLMRRYWLRWSLPSPRRNANVCCYEWPQPSHTCTHTLPLHTHTLPSPAHPIPCSAKADWQPCTLKRSIETNKSFRLDSAIRSDELIHPCVHPADQREERHRREPNPACNRDYPGHTPIPVTTVRVFRWRTERDGCISVGSSGFLICFPFFTLVSK